MPNQEPLVLTEETTWFSFFPRLPIVTSLETKWDGFGLVYMCQPAFETPEMSTPRWHTLSIFTHGNRVIYGDRKLDGRRNLDAVLGGDIVITPANVTHQVTWDKEGDFIVLAIEPQIFASAIDEATETNEIELIPHFAKPDPLIYQIGIALKNTIENYPTNSRLYAETMINALSVHLIQHYSTKRPKLQQYPDGLPRRKLQQIIDYK